MFANICEKRLCSGWDVTSGSLKGGLLVQGYDKWVFERGSPNTGTTVYEDQHRIS